MHSMYGFQQECVAKYDRDIYEQFNVAFAQLPVGVVVNSAVLVVHAGIDSRVSLELLQSAPRSEYALPSIPPVASPRLTSLGATWQVRCERVQLFGRWRRRPLADGAPPDDDGQDGADQEAR